MSTIKKLLALVLALTMVLSVSAAAAYSVVPYGDADSINEDCEVAVEMLYNMGIMKGDNLGNFNPEATITRAEVAKMIYVVLNKGEDDLAKNYTGAKFFSDVNAGDWFEGYVNYAASIKLVQGRPDGTFGPNDPVTCAEAAKMLLTAIGYSAEARGYVGAGWDKQVLSDAAIIGLLDDYGYNTQTYAPRQWVAVMFKNALLKALTYETIYPAIFNSLLTGYTAYEDNYETMGEKYFGLYEWEGVIVANEYADLRDDDVLGAGRTKIDDVTKEFKNWTTDLTEIGEYRWGYAIDGGSRDEVVYVGGEDDNTVFSTGMEVTDITSKSKIGGIRINEDTEYYVNFKKVDYKEFNSTGNGDWLRVVHNDSDSTYAEYVFLLETEMTEIDKIAKDDTVFLVNGKSSDEYEIYEDAAAGDIVLYTKIDDVEYVTLAESFTGKVDKYTYKTRTLTVGGEDYAQSDINYASIDEYYYGDLEEAEKKTEYTYYQDFFGNIRIYTVDKSDSGDLVLLTDAYYETNRNGVEAAVDAYIDGEIVEVDVDYDAKYTDSENFIEAGDKDKWGLLTEYWNDAKAWTNIARTSTDEDGLMSLYYATTYKYNSKGVKGDVKSDYIDLDEEDIEAGETAYNAVYGGKAVKVQATKNTVYYYVDSDLDIITVTGYKNSYDVINEYVGINAMYAVATDVSSDADGDHYWVADVIVIETDYPVFNLNNNVVLGYNVVNKTVSDYAYLDVIGADAALDDLNVINYNGYDDFYATEIETPEFYFNTEDEDGDSHIRLISANYDGNGIYAGTLDLVNKLYDYVVLTDNGGTFYYDENTVVYDMQTSTNRKGQVTTSVTAEDKYEDALELTKGKDYILVVDSDDTIVYAIWVEAADDVAADLYDAIIADAQPVDYTTTYEYAVKVATDALAKAAAVADDDVEAKRALVNGDLKDAYALLAKFRNTGDAEKDAAVANLYVALAEYSEQFKADVAQFDADLAAAKTAAKAKIDNYTTNILAFYNGQEGTAVVATEETIAAVVAAQKAEVEKLTTLEAVAEYVEFDNEAPAYAALDAVIEAAVEAALKAAADKAEQEEAAKVNDDMVVGIVDTEIVFDANDVTVIEQAAAVEAALIEAGYTEVEVEIVAGKVAAASGKLNGITVNFTVNKDDATVAAVANKEDLAAALADPQIKTIVLGSGEYTADLYADANGKKSLTIIGNGDTQLAFANLQVRAALYDELTIENCQIMRMPNKGWGHLVFGSSNKAGGVYTIKNCTFEGKKSQGIYINQTVEATFNIEDCTFTGDFGGEGAITVQNNDGVNVTVNVTGCTFNEIPETSHEIYVLYAFEGWTLNAEGVDAFWKAK